MKELIKGSAIIFIFKVFGAAALFVINILISNKYGAKHLGIYNLLFALMQVSSIFSRVGLDIFLVKIIPTIEDENILGDFLKKVFIRILLLSSILTVLMLLGQNLLNTYLFKTIDARDYIYFTSFLVIPFTLFTIIPEVLRGFQEIKIYSVLRNASQSILILIFLVLFIFLGFKDPVYALFWGILSSFILAIIILLLFFKKKNISFRNSGAKYLKPILRDSYPMFLTSSMLFLMGNVDSFMIGYFDNEYQVGLYNACVRLSFGITFVLAAINGFISPKISKFFHQKDFRNLKIMYYQSLKLIMVVAIPLVILLYIFPSFFLGLFGVEFIQAKVALLILNTSYLVNALFGPVGHILNMTNNHKNTMYIVLGALIINIVGNSFLIPFYGINGAAFATLFSSIFWNIGCFIIAKKKSLI